MDGVRVVDASGSLFSAFFQVMSTWQEAKSCIHRVDKVNNCRISPQYDVLSKIV